MVEDKNMEWFECWFDSPYYHILYKDRDFSEAELFIDNLVKQLQPNPNSRILDLACGKGRHAIYLNKKGFDVTGVDLSPHSITCAKYGENEKLHFYTHDMRKVFRTNYFDLILNLFTSFGYFDQDRDNNAVLNSAAIGLKPGGTIVLDFMNSKKVVSNLPYSGTKTIEGIEFKITKSLENNFIVKKIEFETKGKSYQFEERVKALSYKELEKYFLANELKIVNLWGNYNLDVFDEKSSDRLIIVAKK